MALTTSNIGSSPRIDYGRKGMKIRHVNVSSSSFGSDYSSGFPITAALLGFRTLFTVIAASARNGAGTSLAASVWWTWDDVNGKLRFWTGSTGATNMTEASATQFTANSTIQITAIGV